MLITYQFQSPKKQEKNDNENQKLKENFINKEIEE